MLSLFRYNDPHIENLFMQYAGFAGCSGSGNGPAIMACLRAASTKTIATAGSKLLANLTSALFPIGPIFDGSFLRERPVEAFQNGHFVRVPGIFGSNTNEGDHWSAELDNPLANTSMPNATQTTVYNFLAGQYLDLSRSSFDTAVAQFYPLTDYNGSFSLQGQQMYGEMRYICSALSVGGALNVSGVPSWQFHWDNPTLGSSHGDELNAFFEDDAGNDNANEAVVVAIREFWNSFAVSGSPLSPSASVLWTENGLEGGPRILFHPSQVAMEPVDPKLGARCAFWHSLSTELAI
ncbi:Carboxylic ester hydrolase [Mycena indigotica]|uniref:Carboxylic ester hydrolase n=1 Tax=Mycena indigotica TaxID=2126181 RepID=A0A8H6W2Y3_9AGAR|nr:Carboxylic ester hydrolase [Mycena indigotica]KAF7300946.1 Carboxylic ester hydrolase [Mycena indigotica]